jgi:hypothetical protein
MRVEFRESSDMKRQVNGSYLKNVFCSPPVADWCLVLNPQNTDVFLRVNTRLRRDLEPKSYF